MESKVDASSGNMVTINIYIVAAAGRHAKVVSFYIYIFNCEMKVAVQQSLMKYVCLCLSVSTFENLLLKGSPANQ